LIRCRYIDDVITAACSDPVHPLEQLVLLGAGLDTRAYRLACLRHTSVFELDVEGVLAYKAQLLEGAAEQATLLAKQIMRVPVDFALLGDVARVGKKSTQKRGGPSKLQREGAPASSTSSASSSSSDVAALSSSGDMPPAWLLSLLSAGAGPGADGASNSGASVQGFDCSRRTLWVAEGLLMYLGPKQVANILGWAARTGRQGAATLADGMEVMTAAADPRRNAAETALASAPALSRASPPLHTLVMDVVNEAMARSKLKWYRYFKWGSERLVAQQVPSSVHSLLLAGPPPSPPIVLFMRANGWEVDRCIELPEGYEQVTAVPSVAGSASTEAAAATAGEHASAAPYWELHPISREGLSYSRYLAPPLLDSTSDPRHPPKMLEYFMLRAHVA